MNATLLKALVALVPVGMLFLGSAILVSKRKGPASVLQLVGAGSLVVVVLTHIFEALHCFPGCGGARNIARGTTLTSAALFWALLYFLSVT